MREKFFWVACSSLFLMTSAKPAPQIKNRPEIEQHYKKAQEALGAKQDAIAIREFREIFHLDPRNASAHANLGVIAFTEKGLRAGLPRIPGGPQASAFALERPGIPGYERTSP